ncbi:hypothetical protein B0H14DRAFT_2636378 [Mycena olivaceomarginata]|nr:hypothetical protein B0H14DRAFT_2636378 [Mycena olivaceomarginata]
MTDYFGPSPADLLVLSQPETIPELVANNAALHIGARIGLFVKIAAPVAPHKPTSHLQSSSLPPTEYAVHPKIGWNPVDPDTSTAAQLTLPACIRNDKYDNRPGSTLKRKSGKRGPGAAVHSKQEWKGHDRCVSVLNWQQPSTNKLSAFQQCKRHPVDAENESNPRKRARRAHNHRADREERARVDSPFDAKELEERVHHHGPFFKTPTPLDNEYDAELHFGADDPDGDEHEARQSQPREVREILADDLLPFLSSPWMAQAVDDQEVNTFHLSTSQSRVLHFAVCISWDEVNSKYCFGDIPFLHGNESGNLDFNEVFCHPLLLKTNGSKFGGEVQAEDESVWEELAAATTALVDMPVVSDDDGNDNV